MLKFPIVYLVIALEAKNYIFITDSLICFKDLLQIYKIYKPQLDSTQQYFSEQLNFLTNYSSFANSCKLSLLFLSECYQDLFHCGASYVIPP